ncbi:NAD-dependent epimerase/dehydratase family protein [Gordonia sp. NPDC003950]
MSSGVTTVFGANGFLGSHVVRRLLDSGREVRVMVRPTSDTRDLDDLDVDRVVGELGDGDAVGRALDGAEAAIYCAVDTRAWIRDPKSLWHSNVEVLDAVLDVAARADLHRFVYTSSMCTIGRVRGRRATPDDAFNWESHANTYVRSRVEGERVALAATDRGVPAMAMCVSNTYGAGDHKPTPHGAFVAGAALGRLPFGVRGMRAETVGVDDAADALVRASQKGTIGRRYIVSAEFLDLGDIIAIAADEAGVAPPRPTLPRPAMYALGVAGDLRSRITHTQQQLSVDTVRLMHVMSPMDHSATTRDLDWHPRPVEESVRAAARYWVQRRRSR